MSLRPFYESKFMLYLVNLIIGGVGFMGRYTSTANGSYQLAKGCILEDALARLGRLEDLYESLSAQREGLSQALGQLRAAGKTRSYQFKEKMAQKLICSNVLDALQEKVWDKA